MKYKWRKCKLSIYFYFLLFIYLLLYIFFFKFFKHFFSPITKPVKSKKEKLQILNHTLSHMFRNSLIKTQSLVKKSKFQPKSKKKKDRKRKKEKKTFDPVQWPIKKIHFFREMKPFVICHHSREINTRDSLLPFSSFFIFHPREMPRAISIVGLARLISYRLIECPSGQDPL